MSFSRALSILESKKIVQQFGHSSLEPFLCIGTLFSISFLEIY